MHITIQGAGRGIGLALAHHTLTVGTTHLYLIARNPEQSAGYAQLPPSPNIHWFAMDFLDPASVLFMMAQLPLTLRGRIADTTPDGDQ